MFSPLQQYFKITFKILMLLLDCFKWHFGHWHFSKEYEIEIINTERDAIDMTCGTYLIP